MRNLEFQKTVEVLDGEIITPEMQEKQKHKIPEITASFWILLAICSTLGEAGGELLILVFNRNIIYSISLLALVFPISCAVQISARRHYPLLFWFVMLTCCCFGTNVFFFLNTIRLGGAVSFLIFSVALTHSMCVWYYLEKSFSVTSITSKRKEMLYWLSALIINTLGVIIGYFLSFTRLKYFASFGFISLILFLIIGIYCSTDCPKTLLYWISFIFIRPFGVTLSHVLTKRRGLKFPLSYTVIGLSSLFLIGILLFNRKKIFKNLNLERNNSLIK
jgi:uncharacterized membrane-anchored protein